MTDAGMVLVAEDDEDIRELVAYRLEQAGYSVKAVADGQEALEALSEQRPALCVLDVMMPRLDGYELTRRIRADDATRDVPVILLTARIQEGDVARGFDAGADDYLAKPFSPQELRARVRAVLARR